MVNIKKDLFDKLRKGRNFSIFFKRFDPIKRISEHYHDVPIGDTLCLFNSSGYLEIAINMGKASSLLGLKIDESIQIDFEI
jgi:S-adenosylmethionine hydrolase